MKYIISAVISALVILAGALCQDFNILANTAHTLGILGVGGIFATLIAYALDDMW